MGGGRLWAMVVYGRWSLMGGGRLWEVVAHGGSTVLLYRDTGCLPVIQTTWVEIVCINIMMAKVFYLFTSFALSFHPQSTNFCEGFYNMIATKLNIHWPGRLFMYFIFRCLS